MLSNTQSGYVYSEAAGCPCKDYHKFNQGRLKLIGDNVYECNCGCIFEWYAEDSWFVVQPSRYAGVPEQYDLSAAQDNDGLQDYIVIRKAEKYEDSDRGAIATVLMIICFIFLLMFFFLCIGFMSSSGVR